MDRNVIKKLIEKQYPISVNEYTLSCIAFSNDSAGWLVLDEQRHYTSDIFNPSDRLWSESSDNAHGGLDVSWTFQLSVAEIEKNAKIKYRQLFDELVDLAIDEGWYKNYSFIKTCIDLGNDDSVLIDFIGADRYEVLEKYPSEPHGSSFFVNVEAVKQANPELEWNDFDWGLFGGVKTIYETERGLWDCV